jgi:hypothetical protein
MNLLQKLQDILAALQAIPQATADAQAALQSFSDFLNTI